jgi:hypothetical protein
MQKNDSTFNGNVPDCFVNRFGSFVQGALAGFDRVRLRGTLRYLHQSTVMEAYLNACRVLIKDFGRFANGLTERVKAAAYKLAAQKGRPVQYLPSSQISKEEIARNIASKDGVSEGLIAVLSCVEPCLSYTVRGDRPSKQIHLQLEHRKCTHLYYYYLHRNMGFMHVRVQTWFPFTINICFNGREWLARQMDKAGVAYRKKDNCFVWIQDFAKAQQLLDAQLKTDWPKLLKGILKQCHPLHEEICRPIHQDYYWSASDTEYATDLLFKDSKQLAELYPRLVHHGISTFSSPDVMRFLGRQVPPQTGRVRGNFKGQVVSDAKHRPEGVRLKHSLNGNSLKLYDKQGSVLRVETTILHPKEFKVYRTAENDPESKLSWRILRRGMADIERRAEVSAASNKRYLSALASASGTMPLSELVGTLCEPVRKDNRPYRGLNPWSEHDGALLQAVSRGEFAINGLRNRDLRAILYPGKASAEEQRRQSAAITRKLALLRAHGLLKKVSSTHRYVLTEKGRQIATALLAARQADVEQLTKLAA